MRRLLPLAALALLALPTAARAQWAVVDLPTEISTMLTEAHSAATLVKEGEVVANTGKEVVSLGQQVGAMIHANNYSGAVSTLSSAALQNPLPNSGSEVSQMFAGTSSGTGGLAAGAQAILAATQVFQPTGGDARAQQITAQARGAAAQLAAATQMVQASGQRAGLLPALLTVLGGTKDVKDSIDAGARASAESAVALNHVSQISALQLMQAAQVQVQQAQKEQVWRCSTESFVQQAAAAARQAAGGTVTLVTSLSAGSAGCSGTAAQNATPSAAGGTLDSGDSGAATAAYSGGSEDPRPGTASASGDDLATPVLAQQSWGSAAAANAQAMGVDQTAVAATCVVESNCRNVAGAGTISGPLQMSDATYNEMIRQAVAQNPSLASQVVGKADPATEAIAATQYLKNAATSLQQYDVPRPTWLDTRGYYQFGPGRAGAIATATGDTRMTTLLQGTAPATLAANGITSTTTKAQWQQGYINKVGAAAANTPILIGA